MIMKRRHPSVRSRRALFMERFLPGRDGFTLVEILVVMVILGIGIIPLALVQHRARREVSEADRFTQAITVAQTQLEQMKGMGFGGATPDSGLAGNIDWETNVQTVSFGLERLEVTVTWTEGANTNRSMTIADMVSMR